MKFKHHIFYRALSCFLLTALLLTVAMPFAWAEEGDEGEEEEVYIPEEYYEPVQSNAVAGWPEGQAIQAAAGVVMDLDTGAFLYSKNCDRQLYPASITKIMTCLLTLENADPDAVMTCSPIVYELDENASNVGLSEGEMISVGDALYTLMLESANDTANALAEYVGGSIEGFAQMMNDKAASLGCTGTHFSNPSGLSAEDHYTTAHDMALIARAAYANENFRTICGTVEYEVAPTNTYEETRYLVNHHQMMRTDTDYYMSWCTGGKTGFTQMAWNTLVTYGERDGRRLVCVLLHGNGADQNYLETIDLLNYGFNHFRNISMAAGVDDKTMASLMNVNYLGKGESLQAPELSQVVSRTGGMRLVSIPADADPADVVLSSGSAPAPGESTVIPYLYHDWPVGNMTLSVNPVSLDLSYPWQTVVRVRAEGETGDKEVSIQDTSDIVWQDVGDFANSAVEQIRAFIHQYQRTLILIVGLILIVFLLLLLMILLRSTSDYRSKKKLRAAREEALRREEEIEAKSTAEIEEELRRAMEMEKESREKNEWKQDPGLHDLDLTDDPDEQGQNNR